VTVSKTSQLTIRRVNRNAVFMLCAVGMVLSLVFAHTGPTHLHIGVILLLGIFAPLALKNLRWGLNLFLLIIPLHLFLLTGVRERFSEVDIMIFSMVKDLLLLVLCCCFLLQLLMKRTRIPVNPINVLITFFVGVNLVYAVLFSDSTGIVYGVRLQLEFVMVYFLVVGLCKTNKDVRGVIVSFLVGCVPIAVYAFSVLIRSKIGYGYEFGWLPQHIVGRLTVFGGPNTSGFFGTYISTIGLLLCGFVFFIRPAISKKLYSLLLVLLFMCLVGVIFSFSRRAWVSVLLAVLFVSLLVKRIRFLTLLSILLVIILGTSYILSPKAMGIVYDRLLSMSDSSSYYNIPRINEWKALLIRTKDKCFLGEGLSTVGSAGIKYNVTGSTNTHNYYLSVLVQTGFLGLLSFISIAIAALYFMIKAFLMAQTPFLKAVTAGIMMAFISLLVQNMFGLTTEIYPFNLYCWFFVGLGVRLFTIERKNAT
jgi:putative inorganic carbon (HCO3(-)) transporter